MLKVYGNMYYLVSAESFRWSYKEAAIFKYCKLCRRWERDYNPSQTEPIRTHLESLQGHGGNLQPAGFNLAQFFP